MKGRGRPTASAAEAWTAVALVITFIGVLLVLEPVYWLGYLLFLVVMALLIL